MRLFLLHGRIKMNASKKKKRPNPLRKGLFLKSLVPFLALVVLVNTGTWVSAKDKVVPEKMVEKGLALNLNDREVGSVDSEGNVYNRYEKFIGSVDDKGNVYNISKINIGRVDPRGEVRNQAGTLLGYVDELGNVYNRLRKKVGSIKGIGGLTLTGGAARLLFFSGR